MRNSRRTCSLNFTASQFRQSRLSLFWFSVSLHREKSLLLGWVKTRTSMRTCKRGQVKTNNLFHLFYAHFLIIPQLLYTIGFHRVIVWAATCRPKYSMFKNSPHDCCDIYTFWNKNKTGLLYITDYIHFGFLVICCSTDNSSGSMLLVYLLSFSRSDFLKRILKNSICSAHSTPIAIQQRSGSNFLLNK